MDLTDKAIEFIRDAKAIAPEKPFFLYYAPGACHAPHHAPKEWIEKYKGRFDMGYEAMREQTLARQKELGIVPPDTELPPINPIGTPETRIGPGRQAVPDDGRHPAVGLAVRRGEAAVLPDGRGVRRLPRARRRPDRPPARLPRGVRLAREHASSILVSDNGASGEGGPNGSVNEMKFANGIPDNIEENLPLLDELGGTKTYNHYPNGWAMAFNTPFKMWKRYEFNGGTSDPCIISWPAGIEGPRRDPRPVPPRDRPRPDDPGRARRRAAGGRSRATSRAAFDGVSMRYSLDDASAPTARRTQFYAMLGSRAIWHDGWKAVTNHPTIAGWSNFNDDEWELYHTDVDRAELHNLAAEHPGQGARARSTSGSRRPAPTARSRSTTAPRSRSSSPRARCSRRRATGTSTSRDTAEVPESQAVNVRNRSYAIGALVDIPAPGAEGVLFAHGSLFGGHALYVKDNRLHYVYNFVGMAQQHVVGDRGHPDRART